MNKKTITKKIPKGKLIRVKIEYDNIIRNISITGDFFIHPEEAIEKIEQSLVGTSINLPENELEKRMDTSAENAELIGFSSQDLAQIIKEAVA